jgi:hypothetical protein
MSTQIHGKFLKSLIFTYMQIQGCYTHIGDLTNLAGYPPLKPNVILHEYLLDHNLSLRMDHQFKEDRKTVPTLKNSSISQRKSISGTYLIYRLFARG